MLYCTRPFRASVATDGGNMVIGLPAVGSLSNGDLLKFVICQTIDYSNPLGTVSVRFGASTTTYPVVTRFANDLRIDQLRSRTVYTIGFGSQAAAFTMVTPVPCTAFQYPVVDVSAAPAPTNAASVSAVSNAPAANAKTLKTKKEASNE